MAGVVMLVNEFAPVSGGAEKQAERLAGHLASQHRPVWVITRRLPGTTPMERMNGFTIIRPATWGPGKLKTATFILGALWHLWRLRRQYEIIHAHMLFGPAFAAALAGRAFGKKVLVKMGSSGPDGEIQVSLRKLRGRIRLAALRRSADVVIVLDHIMKAEAVSAKFPPERIVNMANGIDISSYVFTSSREDAKAALGHAGKVVVLFIGRLVVQKSLPTLLRAFRLAVQQNDNLHLLLVGSGPELEKLEGLADELGISAAVSFAGNQSDVGPYLNAADIFALPSETEGMSNALLEAMSSGLACLATPVGAAPVMLDHGRCGVLLPPGDISAWGDALMVLGSDASRRLELGRLARERARSEYDFSVIGARYEALYERLMDQAGARG